MNSAFNLANRHKRPQHLRVATPPVATEPVVTEPVVTPPVVTPPVDKQQERLERRKERMALYQQFYEKIQQKQKQ
jgi:hypothetical protein